MSVRPSFWRIARLIVARDTLALRRSSHSSQWRSRVASSFSSSCFHSACFSSEVARMCRLRPVEGLGSRWKPQRDSRPPFSGGHGHRLEYPQPEVLRVCVHGLRSSGGHPIYKPLQVVLRFERTCERGNRLPRASAARIRKDRGKNPGPPFTRVVLYGPPLREVNYRLLGRVGYLGVGAWSAVE